MDEDNSGNEYCFSEFKVRMVKMPAKMDKADQMVVITVWAAGIEEALTCGEVLSAIYL